jgi:hypothetical protein
VDFLHGGTKDCTEQDKQRDLHIPLAFNIDGLFHMMQSKSTIDNGWWWFNPLLGTPFGLDERAFPSNTNVDQAVVWVVSRFISDAVAAITLSWAVLVAFSGLTATWCSRKLGVSTPVSVTIGVLFALSPYALHRNVTHFAMAIHLVPFPCVAALQLAGRRLPTHGYFRGDGLIVLVGCALLAFNYIYYPFFACFFVCVASLAGFLSFRDYRILRSGALVLATIAVCTTLNLLPSLVSWQRYGKPVILVDKAPPEAEVHGLKIRTLLSPSFSII